MTKKTFLAFLIAVFMLSACGTSPDLPEAPSEPAEAAVADPVEPEL